MHVLDTTMLYGPGSGGVARYLNEKRAWFARNPSHRHSLLVPGPRDSIGAGGERHVATLALGVAHHRWPFDLSRWSRAILDCRPDLIEVEDPGIPGWAALRAARVLEVPVVAFCHVDLATALRRRFGVAMDAVAREYLGAIYRRFDLVLAPSEFMRRRLCAWGVDNVHVRPLGVDLETFNPRARGATLRAGLGLDASARLLVYAGRFAPEKNIDTLLAAFCRLGAGFHLLLIGEGNAVAPPPNVIVRPFERSSRELARIIASTDGFVHCGDQETFGLVLIEAMACGRGVIAAAAGAAPELVTPGTGLLAAPRDAESFAATIRAFYRRDVDAMGHAARAHAEHGYHWDTVVRGLLDIYRRVRSRAVARTPRYAAP
jgi:alpha-1,6-mannosyltransferase